MFKSFSSAVQSTVSSAVQSAVSGAMGEEFAKHYETPRDSTASGGHSLAWKIYPGVSKKTNQEVSIFIFDKEDLRRIKSKDLQERLLDVLRQELKTLRVLRHPNVLRVIEIYEETRRSLSFVTERVTCSLANANKNFRNVGNVTPEVLEIGMGEFDIACGLLHVGEALSFLHREGRRVHLSIGPHSIFITPKGEWKLGGMGFCRVVEPGKTSRSEYYSSEASSGAADPSTGQIEFSWEPPLEYCAPEIVTEPRQFTSKADMFSLGLLVYELFCPPRTDGGRSPVLDISDGNTVSHGYKVQSLHPIKFPSTVPVPLQNTIRTLLSIEPSERPEARAFLASPFFDSGSIKTLRSLQSLVEQEPAAQARFLNDLPDQLSNFSPRVLRDMVLPSLHSVSLNKAVAPFVISPLLKVVEKVDKSTFRSDIAPMLVPLLGMTEPVQCMLKFVSELEILLPKADETFLRDHIVPMLCRALESPVPEILDAVLSKIQDQATLFEYRILKQTILPRVNKLILHPPQATVRVNALVWLAKSFNLFDKDLLIESVVPTLAQTVQSDKTPAVCMSVLACYDRLAKHLGPEYTAKLVLPSVTPLLWERQLNNAQFDAVCEKLQDMLKDVISARDKEFAQKDSVGSVATTAGFSDAAKAMEKNKEEVSGMGKASKVLSEEYVVEEEDKEAQPRNGSDDPFYLGSSSSVSRSAPKEEKSEKSSRRVGRKGSRARKTKQNDGNLLDMDTSQSTGNDLLSMQSTAPPPPQNQDMFNGMNMTGNGYGQQAMAPYGQTFAPPQQQFSQMQMTPYGQNYQQPPPNNMNAGMNMGGMGSQLQLQNGGYQQQQQQRSNPNDPFSAFDGL